MDACVGLVGCRVQHETAPLKSPEELEETEGKAKEEGSTEKTSGKDANKQ